MSDTKIIKCHVCGKTYKFFAFCAGDQSACPDCVKAAQDAADRKSTPEEENIRRQYFGG